MKLYKKVMILIISFLLIEVSIVNFTLGEKSSFKKTIYVDDDGGADYKKIQNAINAASDDDTIYVYNGNYYENNITVSKSINIIGEDRSNTIIDAGYKGDIFYIYADFVRISGFSIKNSGKEDYPNINAGIDINSNLNTITNNIILNSTYGLNIRAYCRNNTLYDNYISNNKYGIYLNNAYENNISSNTILYNSDYGIYLNSRSDKNKIYKNIISNNQYGSRIKTSVNNVVSWNIFKNNKMGLYFCCGANDNIVFYNIFVNNEEWNANDFVGNQWDNGTHGNYWDDYNGIDIDDDGIGDTPYNISIYYQDRYPLMKSWAENHQPISPTIIGSTDGKAGGEYEYVLFTIDLDGDIIYYIVDWGDGNNSGWLGPYNSSEAIIISHIWEEKNEYKIKVKAKDIYDAESNWTTLEVSMQKNKIINIPSLFIRLMEKHSCIFHLLRFLIINIQQ